MKINLIAFGVLLSQVLSVGSISAAQVNPLDGTVMGFGVYSLWSPTGYYGGFSWDVDEENLTATLKPSGRAGYLKPEQISWDVSFYTTFKFIIKDKDNKVVAQRTFFEGAQSGVREFAKWIGGIKFKLDEYSLEIQQTDPERNFYYTGRITNYPNLSFKTTTKAKYSQFAFVPTRKGMYAKYLNQVSIDTSKIYSIIPQARPTYSVGFNEDLNVEISRTKQNWQFVYDKDKFAYRAVPVGVPWNEYNMFWNNPTDDNVQIYPKASAAGTAGEYWHFRKKSGTSNAYEIVSFRASTEGTLSEGYVLNLDTDLKNISSELYRTKGLNKINQVFLLKPEESSSSTE